MVMTPGRLREIAELLIAWSGCSDRMVTAAEDLQAHADDLRAERQPFAKGSSLGVQFGRAGTAVRLVTSWELEA